MKHALHAIDEEFLIDHHDQSGQNHLDQADGHGIFRYDGGQRPAPHDMPHTDVHKGQKKAKAQKKTATLVILHYPYLTQAIRMLISLQTIMGI